MRLEISPLITDISGKVKDVVFSSWKSRKYVRSRALRGKPASSAQTIVRNYYSNTSWVWQQFHDDYKNAWRDYARGRGFSGFNYWMKAQKIPSANFNFYTTSPFNPRVGGLHGLDCIAGALPKSIDMVWLDGPAGSRYKISVYIRKVSSTSIYLASHTDIDVDDKMATVFWNTTGNAYTYTAVHDTLTGELSLSSYVYVPGVHN